MIGLVAKEKIRYWFHSHISVMLPFTCSLQSRSIFNPGTCWRPIASWKWRLLGCFWNIQTPCQRRLCSNWQSGHYEWEAFVASDENSASRGKHNSYPWSQWSWKEYLAEHFDGFLCVQLCHYLLCCTSTMSSCVLTCNNNSSSSWAVCSCSTRWSPPWILYCEILHETLCWAL